jgi:flagellar motor protein MotB
MSYENNNPLHKLSAEEADTSSGYEFGQKPKVEDHGDEGGHDAVNFGHGSHGAHGAGGGHGTEMGWLVSYADMMTLLFGLFVLLYTMSTTNSKGSVEEQMKKMSQEAFGGSVSANDQKEISPDEMLQKLLDKNKQLAADLQKSQEELTLKRDLTTVETEKKMMQQKIDELTQRMQDNETIQKEMTSKVEEQKRQIASIPDITLKIQTVSLENQKIKVELDRAQTKEKELVEKMKNMTPKEKTEASAPVNPNNFLMISTTWATEKHDIDLEIVDTNNKKFNFKKKSYGGVDGQFEIDSRYGPGLEMWKTPKLHPGKYKVKVTLYNSNGNDEPAEVQTNVITVSENRKLPKITLSKTAKTKELRFNVDEKGKITLE